MKENLERLTVNSRYVAFCRTCSLYMAYLRHDTSVVLRLSSNKGDYLTVIKGPLVKPTRSSLQLLTVYL